jgi:hypothetical protein
VKEQAARRKSCRVLNPVELFTMTFQADSKWKEMTPSKLKERYEKDKKTGEGMEPKEATRFYASLADLYSAPSRFTFCEKLLMFEEGQHFILRSRGDVMEWQAACNVMLDKAKKDVHRFVGGLYNCMTAYGPNSDAVALGGMRNIQEWTKVCERVMKIVKPLEECKRHDAHMAWREFMLEVGKMMIIVGANVTRAMDSGPEDAFYNPSAAIVRIMDDSSKPPGRGEGVAESLLDDFGVVSGSPFKEPDATVPMSMVDDDEPWMERYTKEYWDNLSMNHGGAAENAVEDVVVLGGVLEVVDGGAVEN